MDENINLMDYAVVEDGMIVNVLVFDNEQTAEEWGCLPLSPGQGIGDKYLSPEEWELQNLKQGLVNQIENV